MGKWVCRTAAAALAVVGAAALGVLGLSLVAFAHLLPRVL